ncbi:MAG: class II aldolase/adducin family protein [Hungatella sp.]|nr:class II aldolase/adducin family protein [Hungatella sp.]
MTISDTTWKETKKILLKMAHRSYEEALFAGTSGNLSVYDREKETMIITPSSIPYETMEEEDLVLMRLTGEIIEWKHKPSSEWRMHAAVYKERKDVGAVVHTHSPYATSFAVNRESIPVILIEMIPFLGGDVMVADFALPGTEDVGLEALKVLKGRNACLMSNHGVLAVGETLEQAHIRAIYVEDAAKIYSLARSNGDVKEVPEEFVEIMKNRRKGR